MMEVTKEQIKCVAIVTFEEEISGFYYPNRYAKIAKVFPFKNYYIDIDTEIFYPILEFDEEGLLLHPLALHTPYVYGVMPSIFESEQEMEEALKKANEILSHQLKIESLEEQKIFSFQKYKVERKKNSRKFL